MAAVVGHAAARLVADVEKVRVAVCVGGGKPALPRRTGTTSAQETIVYVLALHCAILSRHLIQVEDAVNGNITNRL